MAKRIKYDHDATYTGTNKRDMLFTYEYNDVLRGRGGNDFLYDAPGQFGKPNDPPSNDIFIGGKGDDVIVTVSGDDFLFGGSGDDTLQVIGSADNFACVSVDGGTGVDLLKLADKGDGEWHKIDNPSESQTFFIEGRAVDVVNVEMVYM